MGVDPATGSIGGGPATAQPGAKAARPGGRSRARTTAAAIDAERHVCTYGDRRVLFAIATAHEYGPHLRARIDPLVTGVGPVEAAAAVAGALGGLAAAARLPHAVVSLGSAGSRTLEHAVVYEATRVSYRDMDATALGFARGETPFLGHPPVLTLPARLGLPTASIATGASIVNGAGYDTIGADMADMETYAVVRAAAHFGVPVIALRGISDGRNSVGRLEDWTEYLHLVDARLAEAVDRLAALATAGRLMSA